MSRRRWRRLSVVPLLAALALVAPAGARAETVDVPNHQVADNLYGAQVLTRYTGIARYERLFLEEVLQRMYRENPNYPRNDAQREMARLSEFLRAGRDDSAARYQSEHEQFFNTVSGLLTEAPGLGDYSKFALKAINAAAAKFLGDQTANALQQEQLLVQTDRHQLFVETNRRAGEIIGESRALARDNIAFAQAYDLMFAATTNAGVRDDENTILASSPELRQYRGISSMIDHRTNAIRQELYTSTGRIRLDITQFREEVSEQFAEVNDQLTDIRADIAAIDERQREHYASWQAYLADENARRQAEADARRAAAEHRAYLNGALGSVNLLSTFIGFADKELGRDVFTAGNAAIQIGESLNGWLEGIGSLTDAFANPVNALNTVAMASNVTTALLSMVGILGEPGPSPHQLILDEIGELREQVHAFRGEMHDRFDRVDAALNLVFDQVGRGLDRIDVRLGTIEQGIDQLRFILGEARQDADRLAANMQVLASDQGRREFWREAATSLDYRRKFPGAGDMGLERFINANGFFHTWSIHDAKDRIALGGVRPDGEDAAAGQFRGFELETNVNYLDQYARQVLGVRAYGDGPNENVERVNARDWALGARAFASVSMDWPAHAKKVARSRFSEIAAPGRQLAEATKALSKNEELYARLLGKYDERAGNLAGALAEAENAWLGARQLRRDLVAGNPTAGIPDNELPNPGAIPSCTNRTWKLARTGKLWVKNMHLPQSLFGHRIGAATLEPCFDATWEDVRAGNGGPGTTTGLVALVVRGYTKVGSDRVEDFRLEWKSPRLQKCLYVMDDMGNRTLECINADHALAGQWDVWLKNPFENEAVRHAGTAANASKVTSAVTAKQADLRDDLGKGVAAELGTAGRNAELVGRRFDGAALATRTFVQAGYPASVEADEVLRTLLYGSAALPDLNDVYELYGKLRSTTTFPSAVIEPRAKETSAVLRGKLAKIQAEIKAGRHTETSSLVESTLTVLKAAEAVVHAPEITIDKPREEPPPPGGGKDDGPKGGGGGQDQAPGTGGGTTGTAPSSRGARSGPAGGAKAAARLTAKLVARQTKAGIGRRGLRLDVKAVSAGTVAVTIKVGKKVAGRATLRVKAGTQRVTVRLSRAGAKLLRAKGRRTLTVSLLPAGTKQPAVVRATLRR